jgi:hypothetical protein
MQESRREARIEFLCETSAVAGTGLSATGRRFINACSRLAAPGNF